MNSTNGEGQAESPEQMSPAKALFLGRLLESPLFPFPSIAPAEVETLKMVIESIDRFMEGKSAEFREFDRKGAQPEDYVQALRELGLFGLLIPESDDGIGLSNAGYSRVLQQTSRYDASTSLTIGAHSSIGMKGLLLFGSDDQKSRYLRKLATGEMIAAFCLTEPGSGSDAASIKTSASKQPDGSWVLNGEKIWITNGAFADFFTVFARTDSERGKMSAFIVERGFGGVSSGPKEDKLGIRASATTTVSFQNVRVPPENLLGEEGMGFKVAMSILNNGRTGLGGGCVGGMKRCIALAARQASERKQFGKPIADYPLIKEKLAQMAVDCFATESVVNVVAYMIDSGHSDYSVEAAMSKVFASEALWRTVDEALQIAGGNGFMKEFPYEMLLRDSRINRIFEGTNEILRLYIGLSGLRDAGEYLKELKRGAGAIFNDPIKGFGVLSRHAGRKVAQVTRIGRERLEHVHPLLRSEAASIEHYTQQLARASEQILIRHGKEIIGKQLPTKRVADVATDLFISICVLSRVSTMIESSSPERCSKEIDLARIFVQQAKRRANQNLRRLARNEDDAMMELADHLFSHQGYPWDVL